MTHQHVSFGEHPSFGRESDKYVTSGSARRRLRYNWQVIWAGILLVGIAASGMVLNIYATGELWRIGFVAFVVSAFVIVVHILDPICASASAFRRRRKMHVVK